MAKSLDLNKLKSEIETRKKEKGIIIEGTQGTTALPRDTFLNSLLTSLQTGKNSPMLNNIKTMAARADIISGAMKTGVVTTEAINKINELKSSAVPVAVPPTQRQSPTQSLNESEEYPERDGSIYDDILRKSKNITLADSMQDFVGKKTSTPMKPQSAPTNLNEQYLNESVKKAVDNYLIENFATVLEEAIKGTILEMYAVERIKEVLHENKDMIKTVVIEVIKEISAKAKQNRAQ